MFHPAGDLEAHTVQRIQKQCHLIADCLFGNVIDLASEKL
jgi:hypothetical protein